MKYYFQKDCYIHFVNIRKLKYLYLIAILFCLLYYAQMYYYIHFVNIRKMEYSYLTVILFCLINFIPNFIKKN